MGSIYSKLHTETSLKTDCDGQLSNSNQKKVIRSVGENRIRMRRCSRATEPKSMAIQPDDRWTRHPERDHSSLNSVVNYPAAPIAEQGGDNVLRGSIKRSSERSVRFDNLVLVHTLNDWPPEIYRDARRGPWLTMAADRCRFNRRINETQLCLGDIFSDAHRDKIKRRWIKFIVVLLIINTSDSTTWHVSFTATIARSLRLMRARKEHVCPSRIKFVHHECVLLITSI